jgi:hypothetical protein
MRRKLSASIRAAALATRCGGMLWDGGPASPSQTRKVPLSGSAAGRSHDRV